jgi:FkbM family methyltransferase
VEAQACGTPVVVTDVTSMPELCGSGWKVGYERMWHDSQGGWAAVPRIGEIADAYEQAYEKARDESMRAEAFAFAQDYDADLVVQKYWRPALAKFGELLEMKRADLAAAAKKPRRLPEKIRQADGLMWIDRAATLGYGSDGIGWQDHEGNNARILDGLLPEGGVLLDVGAHVGHWALRLAAKASKVIAVEANPATAATLRRHIAMNGIDNVTVVEAAAWDRQEDLVLSDPNGQTEGGSTRVLPSDGRVATAHGWPLDDLLAMEPRIDLVKLDVEGADLHALRGMKNTLARTRPVLFIECHDIYGYYTRAELEQTLTGLGYTWEVAASALTQWMPDGDDGELRQCDWLTCRPQETT